ncbi:MAG: hypothetical protein QXK32_11850 [Candidatus Jordarchaeales archaeon]
MLFDGLTFMSSYEICCGEPILRAGVFEMAERVVKKEAKFS